RPARAASPPPARTSIRPATRPSSPLHPSPCARLTSELRPVASLPHSSAAGQGSAQYAADETPPAPGPSAERSLPHRSTLHTIARRPPPPAPSSAQTAAAPHPARDACRATTAPAGWQLSFVRLPAPSQSLPLSELPHHLAHIPMLTVHRIIHRAHLIRAHLSRQPIHRRLDPRPAPQRVLPHQRYRLVRREVVPVV